MSWCRRWNSRRWLAHIFCLSSWPNVSQCEEVLNQPIETVSPAYQINQNDERNTSRLWKPSQSYKLSVQMFAELEPGAVGTVLAVEAEKQLSITLARLPIQFCENWLDSWKLSFWCDKVPNLFSFIRPPGCMVCATSRPWIPRSKTGGTQNPSGEIIDQCDHSKSICPGSKAIFLRYI